MFIQRELILFNLDNPSLKHIFKVYNFFTRRLFLTEVGTILPKKIYDVEKKVYETI